MSLWGLHAITDSRVRSTNAPKLQTATRQRFKMQFANKTKTKQHADYFVCEAIVKYFESVTFSGYKAETKKLFLFVSSKKYMT